MEVARETVYTTFTAPNKKIMDVDHAGFEQVGKEPTLRISLARNNSRTADDCFFILYLNLL